MDKQIVAPYVRASRLDSLEQSVQIADQSLIYFRNLKHNFPRIRNPAACVALSLYKFNLINEERLKKLSGMQGTEIEVLLRNVSEIRQLLNLEWETSYEEMALASKLPIRFSNTAAKIYSDLQKEFPDDNTINRAAIKAAIMLVVAIKRGYKRDDVITPLSRVTTTDPKTILENEILIRKLIGKRYGGKDVTPRNESGINEKRQPVEVPEKVKEEARSALQNRQKEKQKNTSKPKQSKLTFDIIPQKEVFKDLGSQ